MAVATAVPCLGNGSQFPSGRAGGQSLGTVSQQPYGRASGQSLGTDSQHPSGSALNLQQQQDVVHDLQRQHMEQVGAAHGSPNFDNMAHQMKQMAHLMQHINGTP